MKLFTFVVLVLAMSPASLFAWGDDGHDAIWAVAQSRLTPGAREAVGRILGRDKPGLTAVWMDRARDAARGRGGELAGDAAAGAFNAKFKYNASWHYVDLPLGAPSFEAAAEFHPYDNVVTIIRKCMDVLERRSSMMDQRTALRVLVHLVGDIHQPLHCASGFYDLRDPRHPVLQTDVAVCLPLDKEKAGDQGGNLLFFGTGTYDQLHGYWDIEAVKRVGVLGTLPRRIADNASAVDAATTGDRHEWSSRWAAESVKVAAEAYRGIQFGACTLNTDPKRRGKLSRIEIVLPAGYEERARQTALNQMTKAAVRLANVLNDIWR